MAKREYRLFQTASGFSCKTADYGKYSKRIFTVRAVNIKQAYFFAFKEKWYTEKDDWGMMRIDDNDQHMSWTWDNQYGQGEIK